MTKSLIQERVDRVITIMHELNKYKGVLTVRMIPDDPNAVTKFNLGLTLQPRPNEAYKAKYLMTMMLEEFNLFSNITCRHCVINPELIDVSFTHSLVDAAIVATVKEK